MTRVQALIMQLLAVRPMTSDELRDEIIKNPECQFVRPYDVLKAMTMLCQEDLVDLVDPAKAVEDSRRGLQRMRDGLDPDTQPAAWKLTTNGAVAHALHKLLDRLVTAERQRSPGRCPRRIQVSKENVAASAPVHQLVGQLRELLSRCGGLPWSVSPDDPAEVCEIRNKHDPTEADPLVAESLWHRDATLIVAAVNALTPLLAIAEAASDVIESRYHPQYDMAEKLNTLECATIDLRTALSLLPNNA
jgi:hypothetical protein